MNKLRIATVRLLKRLLSGVRFRGKGTILSVLCPRNEIITISLFGYAFNCDLSEHIQRSIFLHDYDEDAQRFVRKSLKQGDVFLDVGANVGFYSLMAASIVGDTGRVIAIEPNPRIYALLKETIERNKIKNVLPLNVGLGNERGYLNLFGDPKSDNQTATMVAQEGVESVKVEVVPLDSVIVTYNIERISYLKIDVEGFEPNVFAGAEAVLRDGKIDFIQCEFNSYWLQKNGSSPEILHDLLIKAGFEDVEGTPNFAENGLMDRFFQRR